MPVLSYLAYPDQGKKQRLQEALAALPGCSVIPSENQEILILVTETDTEEAERALQDRLRNMPHLQCLALVAGYQEEGSH